MAYIKRIKLTNATESYDIYDPPVQASTLTGQKVGDLWFKVV